MSRRTFCDVCGAECKSGKAGRLTLVIQHMTSDGQVVAEDYFAPADLCGEHAEQARLRFGFKIPQDKLGHIGEDAPMGA